MPPQNKNVSNSVVQPSEASTLEGSGVNNAWAPNDPQSSLLNSAPQTNTPIVASQEEVSEKKSILFRVLSRVDVLLAILLVLGALGLFWALYSEGRDNEAATSESIAQEYDTVTLPLRDFIAADTGGIGFANQQVVINGSLQANGQLSVNDTLTVTPTNQPTNPNTGQIYFDQTSNVLAYFDGTEFVNLTAGVASIQGNTGEITLTGENGITITDDGVGNITFTGPAIPGGVASLNGLTGAISLDNSSTAGGTITINDATTSSKGIAQFNPANFTVSGGNVNTVQNIGPSATPTFAGLNTNNITPSGGTVTINGNLTVSGTTTLSTPLAVSSGGTGAASLAANGVLVGQGTGPVTAATGSEGECLLIVGGTPDFATCPGGGGSGVTTVGTIDSQAKSADGAVIIGTTIYMQTAEETFPGLVSTGAQTFAGAKTFNGQIVAAGGIDLGSQTLQGTTVTVDFTNFDIDSSGAVTAANFTGGGSGLTSLNASNIASGTLSDARLSANVALLNAPANFTSSLQQGGNDVCTTAGNCSGLGLAVDSLNSLTGALTLEGTAGEIDVNDDGSDTITLSLNAAVTLQGNTFNGANQLVQLNGTSQLPAVSGALLTNLNASALASGTVANARLVNGGALTVTAGTNITGGGSVALGGSVTVNVADSPTFAGDVVVQGGSVTAGVANSQTGSVILANDTSAFTGTIQVGALGQDTIYTLPDSGQATVDICLSTGNCAGQGGAVGGTGTNNTIAKFTSNGSTIGNSSITDDGVSVGVGANLNVSGTVTFSGLANGFLEVDGSGVVSVGTINLGTDTVGDYVANLGTLTGLSTTGNSGEGSTPALSVLYGSTANTAVQGNTALTCPSGTGNLTGGGTSITLGTGGTCAALSTVDNPTFATSVTTPLLTSAGALSITPGGALTVGATGQDLTLQGNGSTILTATDGGFTTTIGFAAPTADTTLNFPSLGAGTHEICTDAGNCAGSGGGVTTSGGTTGRLSVFDGSQTITDSWLLQNGTTLELDNTRNLSLQGGDLSVAGAIGSTGDITTDTQLRVLESAGGTFYGILDVGDLSSDQTFTFLQGGTVVTSGNVDSFATTGVTAGAGLTGGGTTGALTLNIGAGNGITVNANDVAVIYGSTANTAVQGNTQITVSPGTNITGGGTLTLGAGGSLTVNVSDSPTFAGDVTVQGGSLTVGAANSQTGSIILANDTSAFTGTIQVSALGQDTTYTLPDPIGATAEICLDTGNCAGAGGGITGSGTTNQLAKFTGSGTIGDSSISDDGSAVTTTGDLVIQGGDLTVGTSGQLGSLVLNDGNGGQTTTLQAGNSGSNLTFVLPTGAGTQFQCLKKGTANQMIWDDCEGGGGGTSGVTSLNGLTSDLTLQGTTNQVTVNDNGTDTITLSLPQDIHAAATPTFGGLTLNGTLNMSSNDITNAGLINGQTISSAANFTGTVTVGSTLNVNTITPSAAMTVGATGQALTLQGSDATTITATGGGFTTTVGFTGAPTGDVTYNFDRAASTGTYEICTTAANCVGLGDSITGSGTTNTVALFTGSQTVGDSIITQSGSTIDIAGSLTLDNALGVAYGGTGLATTPTNGQLLIGNGTGYTLAGLTNDGGLTITNGSGSIGLAVNYGSTANTAVQGNTALTCPSGTGNLNGGGTSITLGAGGTCADLDTVDDPTFATSVTTPLVQGAGLTLSATGANDLLLQTNGSTRLTIDSTGDLTATGNATLQGGTLAIGGDAQAGVIELFDGGTGAGAHTGTLQVIGSLGQNTTYTLPDPIGATAEICLDTGNCAGAGGGITGSGTNNTVAKFTGSGTIGDSSITDDGVTVGVGTDLDVTGNADISGTLTAGTGDAFQVSAGGAVTAVGVNAGSGLLQGTGGLTVTGAASINTTGTANTAIGNVTGTFALTSAGLNVTTAGAVSGVTTLTASGNINTSGGALQTGGTSRIDNTGNLTNIVDGTLSGDLAVNGGDITSTGALNITPGGALTVGATGQTLTLQGDASSTLTATDSSFTTTVGFATPIADVTLNFPALSAGTYDICTSNGNCAGAGATLQTAYDNSSSPEITLDGTRGALTIQDAATPIGANLLEVQANGGSTTYFAVDAAGVSVTGTTLSTGNINTSGGALQTNSTTRIDNGGNLTNINNATIGGALTANGNVSLGNAATDTVTVAGTIQGASPLVFEGGTADANELTLSIASLSDDRTITLPDETGTVCLRNSANCGFVAGTSADFIQNQNASQQTSSNFWISGTGRADTALHAPSFDAATAAALNIGTGNATSVTVGNATNNTPVTINSGTGTIGIGTGAQARTINIGTGGAAQAVTLGSSNTTSTTTIQAGTGGINLRTESSDVLVRGITSDSTEAFLVQNVAGNNIFQIDTSDPAARIMGTGSFGSGGRLYFGSIGDNAVAFGESGTGDSDTAMINGRSGLDIYTGDIDGGSDLVAFWSSTGELTLQNSADSASAFEVLNASDVPQFVIDNTSNRVYIGNPTADGTGALLVLDTKNTSGDPTGVAGAMYYNSDSGRFRCFQDASWMDCISASGGFVSLQNAYDNSTSPEIVLDSTRGALTLRDAVTPIGANLFEVQNNAGTTTYFGVTASAVTLGSGVDFTMQGANAFISNTQGQTESEAFGAGATVSSNDSVAIGFNASAANDDVAIGSGATASSNSISIGAGSFADQDGIAIGSGAHADFESIAIGTGAEAGDTSGFGGAFSIALGYGAETAGSNQIAIGTGARTTDDNQLVIGSTDSPMTSVFFGSGVVGQSGVTPGATTINATGGNGSNRAGAALNIASGRSTGTAAGGNISLQVSLPGGSGSSQNSLSSALFISGSTANVGIGDATPTEAKLVVGSAGSGNIYASFATSGTAALCWDGSGASLINDCSGTPVADYAEMYATAPDVTYGDLVTIGTKEVTAKVQSIDKGGKVINEGQVKEKELVRAANAYDAKAIGIVSKNYGDFSSTGHGRINEADHPMPVALSGRVPVKISPGSSPVSIGDYITTSTDPGKAMRANQAGFAIGKALESWAPGSGKDTILVFVEQGYYPGAGLAGGYDLQNGTLDADVNNLKVSGDLEVTGQAVFGGLVRVEDIQIGGHITVSSDTAGTVIIPAGQTSADVVFGRPYDQAPKVTTGVSDFVQVIVTDKSMDGFTVRIPDPSSNDIHIDWTALEPASSE